MNYPLISEYVEAIKAAEDNFEQLRHLRPVLGEDGEPVMTSGNFAVVFKMKDEQTGKLHAVKCFLKEQEGRSEAYRQIAEELEFVSSTFLTPIKYLDKELFVDSSNSEDSEFPVLLMDWVEGQTLDKYIREHIDDQYELSLLAYQFSRLAMWLMPQPFAHGDLKPDNILVKEDGTLVLVDYDGMYVPAMKGQKARELGSPDFRHPSRTEEVFDDHIDDFSLASILLSLKAIALQPSLLEEYGASDRLLFSEKDYRNLSESRALGALQPLMQDAELASLYSLYILALSQNNLSQVSFRLFNLGRPKDLIRIDLGTEVLEQDYINCWEDEFGARYSIDRKRLIDVPDGLEEYVIRPGTKVICDNAFDLTSETLNHVVIPQSVIKIGKDAFAGCLNLHQVIIPDNVIEIKEGAFDESGLKSITIPEGIRNLEESVFAVCEKLETVKLPNSLKTIGDFTFAYCSKLKTIIIPNNVCRIGDYAFRDCQELKSVIMPDGLETIGENIFYGCSSLNCICVPPNYISKYEKILSEYKDKLVEYDGDGNLNEEVTDEDLANAWTDEFGVKYSADKKRLLMAPKEIAKYTIIEGTTIICNSAFERCSLTSVTIPNSIKVIGKNAFQGCFDLAAIELPDDLLIIADYAFDMCHSVKSIVLPSSVKFMGCGAFCDMRGLSSLKVDEKNQNFDSRNHCDAIIRTKDNVLIRGCSNTVIPSTVSCIGDSAFSGCDTLCSITIPNSIKSIGKYAFENCELLCSIEIPDSIVTIEDYAFDNCYSLKTISLPSSISKIGYMPFNECGVLSQIVIPKGTKHKFEKLLLKYKDKIVEQGGDENLSTEVTDEDLVNAWTDEYGVKYSADRKRLLKAPTEIRRYSVRNGTKIICNKAFQSTLLAQVIIPNSVLCIGDNAFGGCCLTSIEIPENVQSIGERAFSYNALNSVTIPQNVKHIGKGAFGSCGSLICIIVNKENKFYDSRNDCNAIIETKTNTLIVGCQNTIIPNNVKSVGEWAFTGCCNLSFIFIPKEVLKIGQRAFNGCERLKKISVDKDNEFFDSRNDCNAIIETKTNTLIVGCQNTIIPNSVKTIGEWAFSGCNKLSAINIPESVLSINEGAFSGCSDLSNVELPKGLKELGCRVFSDSGIESIIIPDGIEVISESLFNCCRNLISVNLPNSVTTIENYAFSQCRPLSSISMSDNVITIGDWAFACCSSLASIELSNSIQIIGKGAFYDCESLRTFFIPLGLKTKFEVLLPAYKDKLVER